MLSSISIIFEYRNQDFKHFLIQLNTFEIAVQSFRNISKKDIIT